MATTKSKKKPSIGNRLKRAGTSIARSMKRTSQIRTSSYRAGMSPTKGHTTKSKRVAARSKLDTGKTVKRQNAVDNRKYGKL